MAKSSPEISTSKAADMAGVNKETLRFYERNDLMVAPERSAAGYRMYSVKDIERVRFIKNAQSLGFSLAEIKTLLQIADGDIYECCDIRLVAENKLEHINSQLKQLKRLKATLTKLVTQCQRAKTMKNCPIIESLSSGVT